MAHVTADALEFALKNVTNFGDSDFFPRRFDYRAIAANWEEVKNHLLAIDLDKQQVFRPSVFAAFKPGGAFRVVHQLDPLNHLVYTAAVYMIAPAIEATRPAVSEKVACAYRIRLDEETGAFFADSDGYATFIARCAELAEEYPFVLVADVADYYNQINLHRLATVVEHCDPNLHEIGVQLEWFLMELNDRTSKGIPVGPPASIVLAEANFIDVDEFIVRRGLRHTRYVDDFRIFATSEDELRKLHQDLTIYLYEAHRLIFASGKTRILTAGNFVTEYLKSPDVVETQTLHQKLSDFWADVSPYEFSAVTESAEIDTEDVETKAATLREMMSELMARERLDLGLARRILRKSRQFRVRAILEQVLDNFDFFAPVVTNVVLYLDAVTTPTVAKKLRAKYLALLTSRSANFAHVRHWLEYFFSLKYKHFSEPEVAHFLATAAISNQAIAALTSRGLSWIREHRNLIDTFGRLDRREMIHAAGIRPGTERVKFLERIDRSSSDFLEKTTIKWVRGFK